MSLKLSHATCIDGGIVTLERDDRRSESAESHDNLMPTQLSPEPPRSDNGVNDQRRLREELAAALCKLAQSERLATIGLAITAISHEARNELSGLKLGLDLLPMILDDRETVARTVEQLQRNQAHLCRLLEDVQSFALPVQLQLAPCDLREVWRKAWSSLASAWSQREISVQEEVNGVAPVVVGDAYRLEQVFRNLFDNSLAACADPTVIDISLDQVAGPNPAIVVTVRDNGPGLDAEQRRNIFDAFFTTKNSGGGLGMAIVKRIVEAHGGTIAVGPAIREGAEFSIVLPTAP